MPETKRSACKARGHQAGLGRKSCHGHSCEFIPRFRTRSGSLTPRVPYTTSVTFSFWNGMRKQVLYIKIYNMSNWPSISAHIFENKSRTLTYLHTATYTTYKCAMRNHLITQFRFYEIHKILIGKNDYVYSPR